MADAAKATLPTLVAVATATLALQQLVARRQRLIQSQERAKASAAAAAAAAAAGGDESFVVEIEYCTGCRWLLRAAWMAQELLTTFQTDERSRLRSVQLTPNARQGGVFNVTVRAAGGGGEAALVWSRKLAGRFPESKELKQLVRDIVCPDRSLGHSDKKQ